MSLTTPRSLLLTFSGIAACCFGLVLSAQEPALPPIPNVEGILQQPGIDAPPAAQVGDIESEVLTRGPVHEAFAEQYVADPEEGLIVPQEPPEPIDELPPEEMPEGTNVDWIPGYWAFDEDIEDYIWISGFWRDIPLGQRWVPGYWTQVDQGYQWVAGFWTSSEEEQLSYLPTPPNSLEQGPNIAAPGDNYFWVPGCWVYESYNYRWRPGYWAPSYNDYVWIPARYQWTPRGYVHCTGYWDYPIANRGVLFSPVRFQNRRFPRRYRGYRYQPTLTVAAGPLLIHLFSRPRYRHYYFGDYYAARYRQRGIVPFTSVNRFSSRGYRYDPLFAYYQAGSRRTTFDRLVGWNRYFDRREDLRPPRTFTATRNFARTRDRDVDKVVLNQSILSVSIDEMKRPDGRDHRKFRVLTSDMRDRLSKESFAAARKLTDDRIRFESKFDRGSRDRNDTDRGNRDQGRRDRVESLKLPEVVSLGSRLNSHRPGDRDNFRDPKYNLATRDGRDRDRGSRYDLEDLKERIEQKRREDRDGRTPGRDNNSIDRSGNRNPANSNLAESIRERIEAARQRDSRSTERRDLTDKNAINRKDDSRSESGERIVGSKDNNLQPRSPDNDIRSRSEQKQRESDMRNRASQGSNISESIRERIEAARHRQNQSIDPRRTNQSSGNRSEPKEAKTRTVIPQKETDRGNRIPSKSFSASDLRERIEAARQRQNNSRSPDNSSRRIIDPRGDRNEKSSRSQSTGRMIESNKNIIQPKSSTRDSRSRSEMNTRELDLRTRSTRPQSSSSSKIQNDIRARIEAARKAAEAQRKASEAQRSRASGSSSSKSSRSSDIRSRIQQSQSRDNSAKQKSIQDAINRAREAAAKRSQSSRDRGSSSRPSSSASSRSSSSSSIRKMIESRKSSSKSSSNRERPSRGSEKSKGKRK